MGSISRMSRSKKSKKSGTTRDRSQETPSLSDEKDKRVPYKVTQIFIGAPGPIGLDEYLQKGGEIQNGDMQDGVRLKDYETKSQDTLEMEREASSEYRGGEEGKARQQNNSINMTQEEWCMRYCGRSRRRDVCNAHPYNFQGHRMNSQRVPQCQQPQLVCLPTPNHGACRKDRKHESSCCCNPKGGTKKKTTKVEEPMTPAQQYMTFLQGYALAAAVLMGGGSSPKDWVPSQGWMLSL